MDGDGGVGLLGAARAFEAGAEARNHLNGEVTFWTRTIGDLVVPTGRIVASDPFASVEARPFARGVPRAATPCLCVGTVCRKRRRVHCRRDATLARRAAGALGACRLGE
jgi:hypothetical protein